MTQSKSPIVSFVLATHNRASVVLQTLAHIADCGLDRADYEVIVVDNASIDGTPDAAAIHTDVLIRLDRNAGSCAKAFGCERARGAYIVFLDDDSYPRPGSVGRMIEAFERHRSLGAAGFTAHLPDGGQECSALPGVFIGCGVGLRTEALRAVGGLDAGLFMQAEEYDLSFRLAMTGWTVQVYGDLKVEHLKTSQTRRSDRTTYYDVRNNLLVLARYLPAPARRIYEEDWLARYAILAERSGQTDAYARGVRAGRRAWWQRFKYRRYRLDDDIFERFFTWRFVERRMIDLRADGVRTVVLADLGKNVYAFYRAAKPAGIEIVAIADDAFAAPSRRYRGVPILPVAAAIRLTPDAYVVSNTSYVHAGMRQADLANRVDQPVFNWFGSPPTSRCGEDHSAAIVDRGIAETPKVVSKEVISEEVRGRSYLLLNTDN